MNYQELEKLEINKNIYLLKGDAFLCQEAKKIIINKLNMSNINISIFTDESFDINDMLNACNQFSFFEEKRMVIVQDLLKELNQDAKTRLENYSKNVNKDCVLLLIDTMSNKVFDFVKNAEIVECKVNETFIFNYMQQKTQEFGCSIKIESCKKLNEYCLGNLNRINLEIKKLCDYLGKNKEITSDLIDKQVFKDTELKVFDLTNALSVKDANRALKILNDMLMANEPPIKILGLINGNFRRMLFAKINKGTNAELAKALNVKEFAITKAKETASKFTSGQLKRILNLLLEADYNIKSGAMTQENVLYYVICKIATE